MRSSTFMTLTLVVATILIGSPQAIAQKKGGGGKGGGDGTSLPSYDFFVLDNGGGEYVPALYDSIIDVNNQGVVLGHVEAVDSNDRFAAAWTTDGATSRMTLLDLGPYSRVSVQGMNDLNEVVGSGIDSTSVFPIYFPSPDSEPMTLPKPYEGISCHAVAINKQGLVCGWSGAPDGSIVSVVWRISETPEGASVFGPIVLSKEGWLRVFAYAISECDEHGIAQVVGQVFNLKTESGQDGGWIGWTVALGVDGSIYLDSESDVSYLTQQGGIEVRSINNQGISCGAFSQTSHAAWGKATLWDGTNAITLANPPSKKFWAENDVHIAYDINDAGMIVGEARNQGYPGGLLWLNPSVTEAIRLDDLLPRRNGNVTRVYDATAINEQGVIVGTGLDANGNKQGIYAIPRN